MSDIEHKESKKYFDKGGVNSITKNDFQVASKEQNEALQSNSGIVYTAIRKGALKPLQSAGHVRDDSQNMPAHIRAVELAEKEIVAGRKAREGMRAGRLG